MEKLSLVLISLQRVEKQRKGQTVEKPRKWKFLYSLFKSHLSPQALRPCLDLACRQSCEPPASQWPSSSLCCWPWWCSAAAPRAPWAVSCLRATAIWKVSHVGVRWRECPLCPVWGTGLTSDFLRPWCMGPGLRRHKPQLLCTSCSSRLSSSSAPRALLQVGTEPPGQIPRGTWSAVGGPGHVSEGGKDTGIVTSREWRLQIGCEELLPANLCFSKRKNTAAVPGRLSAWKSEGAWSLPISSLENSGNKEGVECENGSSRQLNGYFLRLKVQPLTILCQMTYK